MRQVLRHTPYLSTLNNTQLALLGKRLISVCHRSATLVLEILSAACDNKGKFSIFSGKITLSDLSAVGIILMTFMAHSLFFSMLITCSPCHSHVLHVTHLFSMSLICFPWHSSVIHFTHLSLMSLICSLCQLPVPLVTHLFSMPITCSLCHLFFVSLTCSCHSFVFHVNHLFSMSLTCSPCYSPVPMSII